MEERYFTKMISIGAEHKPGRRVFERRVQRVLYKANSHLFNIGRLCILAKRAECSVIYGRLHCCGTGEFTLS
jgi:hypothetical protein